MSQSTSVPKHLKSLISPQEWKKLKPEDRMILASGAWQDPANFGVNATTIDTSIDLFPYPKEGFKPTNTNWRTLQKKGWEIYKGFGPLRAAIDSKADYVTRGLEPFSTDYAINAFLQDIWFSPRNELYERVPSWMIRMFAEVEVFVLLVFDDDGNVTIRNLEPAHIGRNEKDYGLITDPDDISTTLFYVHKTPKGEEIIPDGRFILDTEFMVERAKALGKDLDTSLISPLTKSSKHKALGGYRRFVLHWRNLTGEKNVPRDTSSVSAIIEFINLYIMATKWELDYKKSLCAYTIVITFDTSPAGKLAWHVWSQMTDEQKAKTNLTKPLTPGSKVFLLPGMGIEIKSPNLPKISGSNEDLLFITGAGARSPQDLWQGQSAGATHASLRASRHPLMMEVETLQKKLDNFLRYKLLRCCFAAKLKMGKGFVPYSWMGGANKGKELRLEETYTKLWPENLQGGEASFSEKPCEPIDKVEFTFPTINLDTDANMGTLYFGSKHTGLYGGKVSLKTIMEKAGVKAYRKEVFEHLVERQEFGGLPTAPDQPDRGSGDARQDSTGGGN
jgi:hypothetical protein